MSFGKLKPESVEVPPRVVGYVFFFENIVVYGRSSQCLIDLFSSKRMRKRAGLFLGTVKGLIFTDPSGRVLYEYLHHTEGYKRRKWFRNRKKIKEEKQRLDQQRRNGSKWDSTNKKRVRHRSYIKQKTL